MSESSALTHVRKYKTLERWIEEALRDAEKGKPCSALAVIYKGDGGRTKEIHSIKLGGKTWEPKVLADIMQGKAETYAQDLGGIQTFELLAFYGDGREPEASLPFRIVDGELRQGGAGRLVKETPDQAGLTHQLMRHIENSETINAGLLTEFAKLQIQREARLYDREDKMDKVLQDMREEVNDAYALVREMIMQRKVDDHKMMMDRLRYMNDMKMMNELMEKGPMLANIISGKEVFPQNAADTALIEQLAKKIKPEQIDSLVDIGLIEKEAAAVLKMRITQLHERRDKESQELAKVPVAEGEIIQ